MTAEHFWEAFWVAWFAVFAAADLALTLTGHKQWTLSYRVWQAEGHGWSAFRYFVVAFMAWGTLHLGWRLFA